MKTYDAVVVRRQTAHDTSERWFGVLSVESSEVREPFCWTGVRTSDVVEVLQDEHLSESVPAPDRPCSSTKLSLRSLGKGKRKRSATSAPAVAPKRLFDFDDESIVLPRGRRVYFDNPNFEVALKHQDKPATSLRSGLSCRVAPVLQSSPR